MPTTTGTPKFRGSGCLFPQSQCLPSPRTGIALGTRLLIGMLDVSGEGPSVGKVVISLETSNFALYFLGSYIPPHNLT
jgi:hypothetical protein